MTTGWNVRKVESVPDSIKGQRPSRYEDLYKIVKRELSNDPEGVFAVGFDTVTEAAKCAQAMRQLVAGRQNGTGMIKLHQRATTVYATLEH